MKSSNGPVNSEFPTDQRIINKTTLHWFDKQARSFESKRFGWMTILLTAQSCLGSIACGFILKNHANLFMLSICAAMTMGCNAMFIALAPPKVCLIVFYASAILNTLFIMLNLF